MKDTHTHPAHREDLEDARPVHRLDPAAGARPGVARILLIEDHEELRARLAASLEEQEYEVIIAEDGAQGLLQFIRCHPDLVVLDLELSGMYGMRVLGEIRERSPNVPVVFLTNDKAPVDSAISSVTVLRKPFKTEWLLGDIGRALGTGTAGLGRGAPPARGGLRSVRQL